MVVGGGYEVEGCWDFDCCILNEAGDDELATCECLTTESDSACEERAKATRGATIVSECAPGAERDLSRYADEGERCDARYLFDHELWDCTPGTDCMPSGEDLRTCQEVTKEMQACRDAVASAPSELSLAGPVTIAVADGMFQATAVSGSLEMNETACVHALNLRFEPDDGLPDCALSLEAVTQADTLEASYAFADFLDCAEGDASPLALVDDADDIPFTVTVVGEKCNTGFQECLIGGVDVHLGGTLDELEFAETTLRVEGVFCADAYPSPAVCP